MNIEDYEPMSPEDVVTLSDKLTDERLWVQWSAVMSQTPDSLRALCARVERLGNLLEDARGTAARRGRLDIVMDEVSEWQRETFGEHPGRLDGIINHLGREVVELAKARDLCMPPKLIEELADIAILAQALADELKVDLADVIERKLRVNQEREWGEPDAEGVVEHVRQSKTAGRRNA